MEKQLFAQTAGHRYPTRCERENMFDFGVFACVHAWALIGLLQEREVVDRSLRIDQFCFPLHFSLVTYEVQSGTEEGC